MATLTEVEVRVVVKMLRSSEESGSVNRVLIRGASYTESGVLVRETSNIDITDQLTAGQKSTVENILAACEARLKARWNI